MDDQTSGDAALPQSKKLEKLERACFVTKLLEQTIATRKRKKAQKKP